MYFLFQLFAIMHIIIGSFTGWLPDLFLAGGLHYKHQFVQALMPFIWLFQFAALPHWKSQAPLKAIKASCRPRKVEKVIKMWNKPAEVEKSIKMCKYTPKNTSTDQRPKKKPLLQNQFKPYFPPAPPLVLPMWLGPLVNSVTTKKGQKFYL